jgi:hypothetical protein
MSDAPLLMVVGACLFVGSTLLLSDLRWFRRRPLVERVAPYVPGGSAAQRSGVLLSAQTFGQVLGPLARAVGAQLARLFGVTEALALRLDRVHSPLAGQIVVGHRSLD